MGSLNWINTIQNSVATEWMTGVCLIPGTVKNFPSALCNKSCSGAQPASYPMGTEGKAKPGHDADQSPPFDVQVLLWCVVQQLYSTKKSHQEITTYSA
jgi:hypothetical protein